MMLQPKEVCKHTNCPKAIDSNGNKCFGLISDRPSVYVCDICNTKEDHRDQLGYKTTPLNESGDKKVLLEG